MSDSAGSGGSAGSVRSVLLLCWRDIGHPQGGGSETYLQRIGSLLKHPRGKYWRIGTDHDPWEIGIRFEMNLHRGEHPLTQIPTRLIADMHAQSLTHKHKQAVARVGCAPERDRSQRCGACRGGPKTACFLIIY